jgi:hypothetical protein
MGFAWIFSLLFSEKPCLERSTRNALSTSLYISLPVHTLRVQSVRKLPVALKDFASQAQLTLMSSENYGPQGVDWDHKHRSQIVWSLKYNPVT